MTASTSKLARFPGVWGLLIAVTGDRIVEIWGKLTRTGNGVDIRHVNGQGKVKTESCRQRNIISWQPHPSR